MPPPRDPGVRAPPSPPAEPRKSKRWHRSDLALRRAKAWLGRLRWWRHEAGKEVELTDAPPTSRWWGAQRLRTLIGWGSAGDPGPVQGEGLLSRISQGPQFLGPHQPSAETPEHFQICFNFARHLFDLCVVTLFCACSPAFRLLLDILGFRGVLKVWLHGLAAFLVTTYGMYLVLWLVHEYLVQFAFLYGFLQTLVLCVSIRDAVQEEEEGGADPGGGDPGVDSEAEQTA